eukprot:CAMPEP_0184982840 /NCGR_PEP_ID=MMETSP1098-20130426/12234_1 /TAXON_ID=89044 /ORGANISM="Spumella elongata, Strain CCAP 955/1" /LENGTH=1081 /DNA_ID=CAMNT_0027506603 /DNA_START=179 /DNA_END=3424 /DNA_ORIENTATION=+
MAYDFSNTTQSGFHLSEDERMMLNKLKATDPVTKNEIKRLQILRETKLIETTDLDDLFQRYTHTIHRLFKVPIVAITLVDLDRVFIKARIGVEGEMQAPRRGSFCNRILMEDTPAVCATGDAGLDPRFVQCLLNWPESFSVTTDSPGARSCVHAKTVQGKFIHFYASVALVVDGVRVGSLCMFDSTPRPNLVEKALRVLPDFGNIISESMNQRHKLLLGYGSELAELSLSVVYNLKYPIENLQKSFTNLGKFVAFQPSKRVTKVLSYEENNALAIPAANVSVGAEGARGMGSIQEEGSNCSSSNSDSAHNVHHDSTIQNNYNSNNITQAVLSSPLSPASGASREAFSPESDDSRSVNDNPGSRPSPDADLPQRVPIHYKKIVNFDLLEPEKETLVDQMLEVRQRTRALVTILAHSLSVAHDLQAQYHRQQDSAVSTSYTANNAYTSIAGKRPTDEAAKERIYAAGKLNNRIKRIQNNVGLSALSSQEITYQVDPQLCGTSNEPEPVKFQFSGKTLSLVLYSTLFHLCHVFNSKMDVNIRFEERDVIPLHVQLANRVGSPASNRKYIHGGMHRLLSPRSSKSSVKSTVESGKVTRLPSFAMNNTNFAITLSGSSDGSISDAQQREILLLHSRRNSLEEANHTGSELHALQLLTHNINNNINTTSTHKQSARSAVTANHTINTPSDKLYPLHNHGAFTSPRAPVRKNSHGKHNQICGDIYITFKCPLPRASLLTHSSGSEMSPISVPEKTTFSPGARVETSVFENVILRNILSMAQGGFCSSTGSEYFPDPPNPILSSLAVFANGGTRTSSMTDNNSLKMPRCEAISEVREDVSEGDYYILTVRIPCNAYTTSSSGSLGSPITGSMDALVSADGAKDASNNKKLHTLTPIQSLRNFSSSASTAALSTGSESNQNSVKHLLYDSSSSSIDGYSPKPTVPVLFGVQQQMQNNMDTTAAETHTVPKFRPVFNLFSPRSAMSEEAHPDETAEMPLRQKHEALPKNSSDYNATAFEEKGVTLKPKKSSNKIGKSVSLLMQSMAHSLFGRGAVVPMGASADGTPSTSTRVKSMRSVDVRVVPSPKAQHA